MELTSNVTVKNATPRLVFLLQRQNELNPAMPNKFQTLVQKKFNSILEGIENPVTKEVVEAVLVSLSRLCDILIIVEINTNEGGPYQVTLETFSLIDKESRLLIKLIEKKLSKLPSVKGTLRHALNGMSFALRHELKRVFSQELVKLNEKHRSNEICAAVMRAHGLLNNCFQQSILNLAQVFDPSVSGKLLFDVYGDRLEQSTILIKDLSSFVTLARQAEERKDKETSDLLITELKEFCSGSLHYLMYKDWDEFEDIAREVAGSNGSARHSFILHCFIAYLETLINQVQMRGVLNEKASQSQVAEIGRVNDINHCVIFE